MKWWFSDYDGTLFFPSINNANHVLDKDLDFIHKWVKTSKFIIATGRPKPQIKAILDNMGVTCDYYITNNGAVLYDKSWNKILEKAIDLKYRAQIVKKLDLLLGVTGIRISSDLEEYQLSGIHEEYILKNTVVPEYFKRMFHTDNRYFEFRNQILTDPTINNIGFLSYIENFEYIRNLFCDIEGIKIIQTAEHVLEIMNKDVSKVMGIEYIQNSHNVLSDDIYVSGDGENDVEMLKKYKNSFAISTGHKKAISVAKNVINNVWQIEDLI